MTVVISADEIKKSLKGYSPDKSEIFHRESARKADKEFEKTLKESKLKNVVLLNGRTASGKTEFLVTQLVDKNTIVLDATLSTKEGARIKLRKILKSKKNPVIYSVVPDNLKRAFIAFLGRERKFSDTYFYKTHSGSRNTLLWIAVNYPDVEINIVESSYDKKERLQFEKLQFTSRRNLLEYLESIQKTEDEIVKAVL